MIDGGLVWRLYTWKSSKKIHVLMRVMRADFICNQESNKKRFHIGKAASQVRSKGIKHCTAGQDFHDESLRQVALNSTIAVMTPCLSIRLLASHTENIYSKLNTGRTLRRGALRIDKTLTRLELINTEHCSSLTSPPSKVSSISRKSAKFTDPTATLILGNLG